MMATTIWGFIASAAGSLAAALFAIFQVRAFDKDKVVADYNAVKILRNLLKNEDMSYRSFSLIRHYVGGYSDDDLRKLLVRAGAIRAISADGREVWALWARVTKRIGQKTNPPWRLEGRVLAAKDEDLFPAALPQTRKL